MNLDVSCNTIANKKVQKAKCDSSMAYDNQVQWHMIIKAPLQLVRGVPNSSLLRGLTIIENMSPLFQYFHQPVQM